MLHRGRARKEAETRAPLSRSSVRPRAPLRPRPEGGGDQAGSGRNGVCRDTSASRRPPPQGRGASLRRVTPASREGRPGLSEAAPRRTRRHPRSRFSATRIMLLPRFTAPAPRRTRRARRADETPWGRRSGLHCARAPKEAEIAQGGSKARGSGTRRSTGARARKDAGRRPTRHCGYDPAAPVASLHGGRALKDAADVTSSASESWPPPHRLP